MLINNDLWYDLDNFMMKMCEGRDSSHGYNNMLDVAELSLKIYENI